MNETPDEKPGHVKLEMSTQSSSKRMQPLDQKDKENQSSESWGNTGRSSKSSPKGKENTWPKSEVKVPSQKKFQQSWAVSSCGPNKRSSKLKEKKRDKPSPSRERGRDKLVSTHRRDISHTKLHVRDQRPQPRSPVRTLKRSRGGDSPDAPYHSAKRCRKPSLPEASLDLTFSQLMSRVFTNLSALQVTLDDLQAPGGAFLHVPSSSLEPTVSQRAWLTWQLYHAGATVHWALQTVNSILNSQASLPRHTCPQGYSFTADPRTVPTSSLLRRPRSASWHRKRGTYHFPTWDDHSRP
uniref:Predicted gene 11232 n=1 Tax=Mus musculus TaxID=10090 RepID=Q5SPI8_MOUSE